MRKVEYYRESKQISEEIWIVNGLIHRRNKPAVICYDYNGQKTFEQWALNGIFERKDGPTEIEYHPNGNIFCERWYIGNDCHMVEYKNGIKCWEGWYVFNGDDCEYHRHRIGGPAIIYYKEGRITKRQWFINGTWYINGRSLVKDQDNITDEELIMLKLKFG